MWVAYDAIIRGIIKSWQYYGVCGHHNGIVLKILGDEWINTQILSIQSLEAHWQLQSQWEDLTVNPKFELVLPALNAGLKNMAKWYHVTDHTLVYFICHSKYCVFQI